MASVIELAPSILSANFAQLGADAKAALEGGGTVLHLDVMDGHFVPNMTIGPPVVASLRKTIPDATFDCHLMIENPDEFIPAFAEAGANWISVHQEACVHLDRTLHLIESHGCKPGVVINPATPVHMLDNVLEIVHHVLVMSVNPGFGAQHFIPNSLKKVESLARIRESAALGISHRDRWRRGARYRRRYRSRRGGNSSRRQCGVCQRRYSRECPQIVGGGAGGCDSQRAEAAARSRLTVGVAAVWLDRRDLTRRAAYLQLLLFLVIPSQTSIDHERSSRDIAGFIGREEMRRRMRRLRVFRDRRSGMFSNRLFSFTGSLSRFLLMGVSIAPGAMLLMVMLNGASSMERLRVSIFRPPLLAQ